MMKKTILALLAMMTLPAAAQMKVKKYVSTNVEKLNTSVIVEDNSPFQLYRTLMAGYNTICLPVTLSATQLQAAAKEVRIERFCAMNEVDGTLNLCFIDCTAQGLQAGVPYLIYSPKSQVMQVNSTAITAADAHIKPVTLTDKTGNTVTFDSAWEASQTNGRYGIPAQQDALILESILVRTEGDKTFLPTRCGFTWTAQSGTATTMKIKHITSEEGEATSITALQQAGARVDIYSTDGKLVKAQITINEAQKALAPGIYVVQGEKFAIK